MRALPRSPSLLGLLIVASCGGLPSRAPSRLEPAHLALDVAVEVPSPAPRALTAESFERLDLPSGETAFLGIPSGAREKRPVLVGVHGAGDRPDWSCLEWQAVTAGWAFVVCPRGVAHPKWSGTYVWSSAEQIAMRADHAVAAARERYGEWMEDGPMLLGAWSQGATLASQVVALRRGTYDRVAMVEVGHTPIDARAVASTLAANGVERAVVSCSSAPCRTFATSFARAARHHDLKATTVDVGDRGHWFDEPVFRALGPAVVWMVDDRPRNAGLAAAVDARWVTD